MGTIDTGRGNSGYVRTGPSGVLSPVIWRILSAVALLAMAGIHLYLVFDGVGGVLGFLFVLIGITETLDFTLVPTTLVVEPAGIIVLAATTFLALRLRHTHD